MANSFRNKESKLGKRYSMKSVIFPLTLTRYLAIRLRRSSGPVSPNTVDRHRHRVFPSLLIRATKRALFQISFAPTNISPMQLDDVTRGRARTRVHARAHAHASTQAQYLSNRS